MSRCDCAECAARNRVPVTAADLMARELRVTAMFLESWAESLEILDRPVIADELRRRAESVRDTIAAAMGAVAEEVRA